MTRSSTVQPMIEVAFGDSGFLNGSRPLLTLLAEAEKAIHSDPDVATIYLNQAIDLLTIESRSAKGQNRNQGGLARWQISRIDSFITDNIESSIRTTELASLLRLSVSHFSHAFKQSTGMTPLMYVAARRVELAAQYMLSSANRLSEIALSHGFCDQSHFCRVFRRETGLSPQTWRKLHSSDSQALL